MYGQTLFKRLKRSPEDEPDRRAKSTGDQTKSEFKNAVKQVKAAGTAIEYSGGLNRASVVSEPTLIQKAIGTNRRLQNCDNADCTHVECEIKQLKEDEYVLVELFARLWVNTLIDKAYFDADISSLAIAKVSSVPFAKGYSPPAQMTIVNRQQQREERLQ